MAQLRSALHGLETAGHLVLPHGTVPRLVAAAGHEKLRILKSDWEAAQWNPPEGVPVEEDVAASEKPTWETVIGQVEKNEAGG